MTQQPKSPESGTSRRRFLGSSVALMAGASMAPYFVPRSVLAGGKKAAPSDRIVMGAIGTGGKGRHNVGEFLKMDNIQFVGVCDVDENHLKMCQTQVNEANGNQDCFVTSDYRELAAHEGLDAMVVSTPDHWHALASIESLKNGLDVYCEKPLANSVAESKAIRDATKKYDRVLQTGSHERSNPNCRLACEIVRSGRIGKLNSIRIQMPSDQDHHKQVMATSEMFPEMPIPGQLDYDKWLGHTAALPYTEKRVHFWWRFILAYGGGEMTDRGAHIIDIGQLGNDTDSSGPIEYAATGGKNSNGIYDAFMDYTFVNTYANGVKLIGVNKGPRGLRFEGSDGWIFVHIHGGRLEASDPELLKDDDSLDKFRLGRSPGGHHKNFIDCVMSREEPMASAEVGHRTATICHLNNIAMKTNSVIEWDPVKEEIVGNDEAQALCTPVMRKPYTLDF